MDSNSNVYEDYNSPDDWGDGFDSSPVMESVDLSKAEPGDVFHVNFPRLDLRNIKNNRRIVILRFPDNKLRAVRVSCLENKDGKRKNENNINRPYNHTILDWKGHGFTKPGYLVTSEFRYIEQITGDISFKGKLSKRDLDACNNAVKILHDKPDIDEFAALGVLKGYVKGETKHPSGNNNNCKCQTIYDVMNSLKINCVDASTVMHRALSNNKREHAIVKVNYFKKNNQGGAGHLYVVFKGWNGYMSIRIFPHDNACYGEFVSFAANAKLIDAVNAENKILKYHFDKKYKENTNVVYNIFDKNDLIEWDKIVDANKTQKELLEAMEMKKLNLKVERKIRFSKECFNLKPLNDLR